MQSSFSVFLWPFDINSEVYAILFPKFLYPLNNIIFNCSIFLTIVIAYERWFLKTSYEVFRNFFFYSDIMQYVAPMPTVLVQLVVSVLVGG